ncbi:MAG TPA: hypothetical protein DCX12_00995 [Chloroflexi bacterium]|jgi:uncharacterized protein YodC (DUF2158 family)|nr:hypothetical protein [Chloroflexota bacterium]
MISADRFSFRCAPAPRPRPQRVTIDILRPGTEVELSGSGVPPIRARVSEVCLSASGYRVIYVCSWWDSGHRFSAAFEPPEIAPAEDRPGDRITLTL